MNPAKTRLLLGSGILVTLAAGCGLGFSSSAPPTTARVPTATGPRTTVVAPATTTSPRVTAAPTKTVAPTTVAPTTVASTTTVSVPATSVAPTTTLVGPSVPEGSVLMVGDSVTIDVAPYLQPAGVTVNGEVGRQFSTGIGLVADIAAAHQLPPTLVVALGTNGTVTSDEIDQMVHAAVGARHIVFVTIDVPRSWEVGDNAVIEAAPARYPGLVTVANWNAVASAHPEWFTEDQVHLQTPGAQALAAFVLAAVS